MTEICQAGMRSRQILSMAAELEDRARNSGGPQENIRRTVCSNLQERYP